MKNEITEQSYWDNLWKKSKKKNLLDINNSSVYNYVFLEQHKYFKTIFKDIDTKGKKLLEIGCGDSVWLGYFKKQYDFDIVGLDYSEAGCNNVKELLKKNNIESKIVCADLFNPPNDLLGQFDYVVSFGVMEHFKDTPEVIKAFHKFLKYDGMVITNIPNMSGLIGIITKITNKEIYNIHNPLSKNDFEMACHKANVEIIDTKYFLSNNFGVLNSETLSGYKYIVVKIINAILSRISLGIFLFEKYLFKLPTSKIFSPYIHIITKNKG